MLRLLPLLAAALLLAPAARAQSGSGLSFLRLGVNAAALGVGDAHVAYARDAWATTWNPAGLAAAAGNSAGLSHHLWFADTRTYALAGRFAAGTRGGLGLFVTATTTGDLEARTRPGDPEGFFDAGFVAAGAAYGRAFGPVRLGLAAKLLAEQIYTDNATGYAVDLGAQADLFGGLVRLGAALQNLGSMNALDAVATSLPRTLRAGATVFPFRILTETDVVPLVGTFVSAEVAHLLDSDGLLDDPTRLHVGAGVEVVELVTVRAGYVTNDALRGLTLGGGLGYEALVVDYAFLPFEGSDPGHVLTLTYGW